MFIATQNSIHKSTKVLSISNVVRLKYDFKYLFIAIHKNTKVIFCKNIKLYPQKLSKTCKNCQSGETLPNLVTLGEPESLRLL